MADLSDEKMKIKRRVQGAIRNIARELAVLHPTKFAKDGDGKENGQILAISAATEFIFGKMVLNEGAVPKEYKVDTYLERLEKAKAAYDKEQLKKGHLESFWKEKGADFDLLGVNTAVAARTSGRKSRK